MPTIVPNEELSRRKLIGLIVGITIVVIIVIVLLIIIIAVALSQARNGKKKSSCTTSTQCDTGYLCSSGECKGQPGTFCRENEDCLSGTCNTNTTVCE